MSPELQRLIEEARKRPITPEELRRQGISFAYGNASCENPNVTREEIERFADQLADSPVEKEVR